MCCCEVHLSRDQKSLHNNAAPVPSFVTHLRCRNCKHAIVRLRHSRMHGTSLVSDVINFSYLTSVLHPPLPGLHQVLKHSRTAIPTMGCALSHSHHDQRSECRQRQPVRPHRERQGREELHRDRSGQGGPIRKQQGLEEPQGELREGDERHMKGEEEEEGDGAQCARGELREEQRERAEPPTKRSGQERLRKGQRVPREPHRERIGQKNLCEEMRRGVDIVRTGWAHPYVRQGLGFKHHKAHRMRDEARRERYEPVRQAKENFRRQYDEYKKRKGGTADPQRIVPAPQMTHRNTVAASTRNLSGMTLVN